MRRWWGTLGRPEQVGVIGAVVTLVVGILAAIPPVLTMVTEPPSPTTTTTTTTSTTIAQFPTDQERSLLARVPGRWRAQCQRYRFGQPGERAAVVCDPSSGATKVWYVAFDTPNDMYRWYFATTDQKRIARSSGTCDKDQIAENTYQVNKVEVGHLACWRDAQQSWILWAHTGLRVAAVAYRADLNDKALYDWWTTVGALTG